MRNLLKPRNLIIVAFVVMAAGVLIASWVNTSADVFRTTTEVVCNIGSEKDDFLSNPEVQRILANRYGLEVDFDNMGSIDQALLTEAQLQGIDCLWPSNTSALEIFRAEHPNLDYDDSVIFNSPIVLYTWNDVLLGLENSNVVEQTSEGHYVVDAALLFDRLADEDLDADGDVRPTWEDLGVDRFNSFQVITTDPTRSNSGNMFYGLFLNMLNEGNIVSENGLDEYYPVVEEYFISQGLLEGSSGDLFDKFIQQGSGAYPLMANYESLIIEVSVENEAQRDIIRDRVRIIYPQPTVYSAHPLIALTDNGERLMDALSDPEIQTIAWEQHGFRSGILGVDNDPSVLDIAGIPAEITQIINLPSAGAMIELVNRLQG